MSRLRIGLFGHGRMGRHHARHLRELGVDLCIVDPAEGFGLDGSIDAAIIAVPTVFHAAVAEPLLAAGVPCLIEKPLAASVAEALRLAAFPQVMVGHIERFNPAFSLIAHEKPRFVQTERLAPYSGRATDVDVVLDLMIHDLDLFLGVAPEDPVVEVQGNGVVIVSGQVDIAQARVRTAAGRVGNFTASRVSRVAKRNYRAFAEGHYWSLDLMAHRAHRVRWDTSLHEEVLDVPVWDALRREIEAFLGGIETQVFPVTAQDGLRALQVAEQIRAQIGLGP